MKELCKEFGISQLQLRKILSGRPRKVTIIRKHITERKFEFGIISDTHLCSYSEMLNELHTYYSICKKDGIKHIIHAGDLIDGGMSHPGWENEIHTHGADRQVQYVVDNYPKFSGITTYFINGSHDSSFWKRAGVDVGKLINQKRPDLVYLGRVGGDVEIGGVLVRSIHPSGGMPYAKSYRGQKIAENIVSGDKPHVLVVGHLHVMNYFFYRNIHVLNAGCFQRQTAYLAEKGLNPDLGGWTIKVRLANDKKRSIVAITPTWIPFMGGGK